MDDNIISHPRLIQQKELELEEIEMQIETKRNMLFRDYEILSIKTRAFENTRRRHALEVLFAFIAGITCGTALLMIL